ncbi:glycosyltransferase family 59 protein [Plenodomus tracheiphilus IPT5]|uniref:Dol-P-Glc:Glc(2)Man(9)GlcNAc(2)-PP-Dol alpha-1,2-glucosyltransferase n=1 Tax=Plenodomus tracheiphilus IPT5 TaxID=1408161 RepID=A0A6A7ATG5_9PLEO|nr:glycosyltransferase family 59 protein [Plenodomus tracheiphilus IPT5]
MSFLVRAYPGPLALSTIINLAYTWFSCVSREVPEPYLDEYFHVPQAQQYCNGDYTWDPKITTPPGLYLVSQLLKPLLGCDTSSLRILNTIALCALVPLSYGILRLLRARGHQDATPSGVQSTGIDPTRLIDAHSALNIALFPPLFFFSALYYTDILSTVLVLGTYGYSLRDSSTTRSIAGRVSIAVIGFMALWFRQTNIFWVAIFPAGLDVIDALNKGKDSNTNPGPRDATTLLRNSRSGSSMYDCALQDAGPQNYILFVLSLTMAALRKPLLVLRIASPYIALLIMFAGFVIWNGSVVLGDKSAHTATVHIPQMLYIWPYIAFFSFPLLVGPLLRPVVPFLPKKLQTIVNDGLNASTISTMPTFLVSVVFSTFGLIAVHFNTIIHPYTLADNRHYVFYVFRIIRHHPAIKYLAVPVYFVCAWLVLQALASQASGKEGTESKRDHGPTNDKADHRQPRVSFITIWLATTALSVVTAPLVEPRYFIIPWIIWRLHVPCVPASLSRNPLDGKTVYNKRLILETIWLLAINAAVSYTFLYRTFTWPSEPGKLQRFLW